MFDQHVTTLAACLKLALERVSARLNQDEIDELYITSLSCDGQYVTVVVGFSNITDFQVEIDSTTMMVVKEEV